MQAPKHILCPCQEIWATLLPSDEGITIKIMDVHLAFEQIHPYVQLA